MCVNPYCNKIILNLLESIIGHMFSYYDYGNAGDSLFLSYDLPIFEKGFFNQEFKDLKNCAPRFKY